MVTAPRATRTFQPIKQPDQNDIWYSPLPLDVMWGIYARQSTVAQLTNNAESTEMQTDDLINWLTGKGVHDGHWKLFDADLGVSGTLRIDERTGLEELVAQIKADSIKAVLVYQISRLFRDDTGVQYNTFAQICKEHDCVLVTSDGMVFNFNNRMHVKMFRFLAEYAAEYIPQQIGLLHAARMRKARKGLYAGLGSVPAGYIVDYAKESTTYKKYIPYEPHARVIRFIFQRYFELGGNLLLLRRELSALPVLFPKFNKEVDHRNVKRFLLRKVAGGYHLSRQGLGYLLTNPTYLGWWIVQGDIISRENHTSLFDKEHAYLFWFAFHRLSPYTVDGEENTKRETQPRRFYQKQTAKQLGLLKEKMTSPDGTVYCHVAQGSFQYVIAPKIAPSMLHVGNSAIDARVIDAEFTKRFFEHLQATHDFDEYQQWLGQEVQKQAMHLTSITQQLQQVDMQQEAILQEIVDIRTQIKEKILLEQETDPLRDGEALKKRLEAEAQPLINKLRMRFNKVEDIKTTLMAKLPSPQENQKLMTARQFADFQTEVQKLIPVWDKKPFAVRQEFINLFVKKAVLTIVATHWVRLDIIWSHPAWQTDTLYMHRNHGSAFSWKDEEKEIIRTLYPTATQKELLQLLPEKSWAAIVTEAHNLGIKRAVPKSFIIPRNLTWSDWQFMQEHNIAPKDRGTKYVSSSSPVYLLKN